MLQKWQNARLLPVGLLLLLSACSCTYAQHGGSAHGANPHDPLPYLEVDLPVEPNPCLPGFLVVGAQKGGTSSVHWYIRNGVHPGLSVSKLKEHDFFNRHIERGVGFDAYLKSLSDDADAAPLEGRCSAARANVTHTSGTPRVVVGEASPNYLPTFKAPPRVNQHLPNARLVVLLKHPVLRAISAFNMFWQERVCKALGDMVWTTPDCYTMLDVPRQQLVEDYLASMNTTFQAEIDFMNTCYASFERGSNGRLQGGEGSGPSSAPAPAPAGGVEVVQEDVPYADRLQRCWHADELNTREIEVLLEKNATLWRSMYGDQLARWLREFSPNRFLLWSSEDFDERPAAHMAQLAKWVGLDPSATRAQEANYRHHARKKLVPVPEETRTALLDFFRPHNARFYDLLRENGFGALADRISAYWDKWPETD